MAEPTTNGTPRDDGVNGELELIASLMSAQGRADPAPLYEGRALPGCRHAVAKALLQDPRFGPVTGERSPEPFFDQFSRWLLNLDGERHERLRKRFAKLFTVRRVEAFRRPITERAAALLDAVADGGRMDLVADFARPLPYAIIAQTLGVPEEDREAVGELMLTLARTFPNQADPAWVARGNRVVEAADDYFRAALEERMRRPRDDFMSLMVQEPPADAQAMDDLVTNCTFFIIAGHDTTTSLISCGTLLLLEHPDQLERLRADATRIKSAVEEMLRMTAPVSLINFRAREDADLEGFHFPEGVERRLFPSAINRDREVFPEPDVFDIERSPNPHLSFSLGPHFCPGAPLARMHGEIAIPMLLDRLSGLRLDGPPEWRGAFPLRELEHLNVAWDA